MQIFFGEKDMLSNCVNCVMVAGDIEGFVFLLLEMRFKQSEISSVARSSGA